MNDFLGHANGDRLLVTIADRIRTSIRVNDYCARLGGDEFVVLLDEANSEMEVLASAYRLLELVAAPVDLGGQLVSHTASIGIAIADTGSIRPTPTCSAAADGAMYVAKAGGRNKAVLLDEKMRADLDERSRMELDVARGAGAGRTASALPARGGSAQWPVARRSRRWCAGSTRPRAS